MSAGWLTGRRRTTVVAIALSLVTATVATAQTPWPSEKPPGPRQAKSVDFPPYQLKTLKNGLQVLVVNHHEQPSISFRLLVKAGAMQEPADRPGVASMVATPEMVPAPVGSITRSGQQLPNASCKAAPSAAAGVYHPHPVRRRRFCPCAAPRRSLR